MENENNKSGYVIAKEPTQDNLRHLRKNNALKEQLDWIKRQLEYASFATEYKLRFPVKKGEIYEFDWGINVNAEFSNRHYGLVLKDSSEYDPLVLVVPLKTNKRGPHPMSDIDLGVIDCLQSEARTLAVINQARSLDKMRIFSRNAISDGDIDYGDPLRIDDKKLQLVLTAYYNFVFGNGAL